MLPQVQSKYEFFRTELGQRKDSGEDQQCPCDGFGGRSQEKMLRFSQEHSCLLAVRPIANHLNHSELPCDYLSHRYSNHQSRSMDV